MGRAKIILSRTSMMIAELTQEQVQSPKSKASISKDIMDVVEKGELNRKVVAAFFATTLT